MTAPAAPGGVDVARTRVRNGSVERGARAIPAEVPVAITYGRATCAVMMASPCDLEDFGIGFTVSEGIAGAAEVTDLAVIEHPRGHEVRMDLAPARQYAYLDRRRLLTGVAGCGLCGIESLEAAAAQLPPAPPGRTWSAAAIAAAMAALAPAQHLNHLTHAVHAAGFWTAADGLVALREDVGRHNALDKLIGALARRNADPAQGVLCLTSRVSIELVQKAGRAGFAVLAAVSAPTAAAIEAAEAAGLTLIAVARADGFEIFTHPHRIHDLGAP